MISLFGPWCTNHIISTTSNVYKSYQVIFKCMGLNTWCRPSFPCRRGWSMSNVWFLYNVFYYKIWMNKLNDNSVIYKSISLNDHFIWTLFFLYCVFLLIMNTVVFFNWRLCTAVKIIILHHWLIISVPGVACNYVLYAMLSGGNYCICNNVRRTVLHMESCPPRRCCINAIVSTRTHLHMQLCPPACKTVLAVN